MTTAKVKSELKPCQHEWKVEKDVKDSTEPSNPLNFRRRC